MFQKRVEKEIPLKVLSDEDLRQMADQYEGRSNDHPEWLALLLLIKLDTELKMGNQKIDVDGNIKLLAPKLALRLAKLKELKEKERQARLQPKRHFSGVSEEPPSARRFRERKDIFE